MKWLRVIFLLYVFLFWQKDIVLPQQPARILVKVTIRSLEAPCISKEADKKEKEIKVGEIVTYTIKYDNDLNTAVANFSIIDEIPDGTLYLRDSAEINNEPHIGAKVLVEYWDGKLWRGANWDNLPDSKVQKIKWTFDKEILAQDNSDGENDTKDTCDGEFPDYDAGIVKFRVSVERVIIK